MGFYIERISDLKNDSRKGPVRKLVMFSLPVFCRVCHFFNEGENIYKSTLQCFYNTILVVFHSW